LTTRLRKSSLFNNQKLFPVFEKMEIAGEGREAEVTDPASAQIFADDLTIGQTFVGEAHKIGDNHFRAFADMTGDDHPIHYDDAYAAKTRFGKRLAHGLLVMSMTALGATSISRRIEDAMVAFVEEGARFLKPVFVNDTLTSRFEVAAIDPKPARGVALVRFNVSLSNDRGEVVLEGHHCYLLLLRSAAKAPGLPQGAG
jgi:3-hydroxybutyryl-CoA dehydratase